MAEIEITEIQRLKIQPGDRIIVRVGVTTLSVQEAHDVAARIRQRLGLGDDTPVMVLGRDDTIEVAHADSRTLEQAIDARIRFHSRLGTVGRMGRY